MFLIFLLILVMLSNDNPLDIYLKNRVAYLKQRIKELEKFFLELDAKKSEL